MTQNALGILSMENVAYSDFMKITQNDNVRRMNTRDIIVHTQNSAISTFHALVNMPSLFLNNMRESLTKQRIQDSTIFEACTNKLLVNVWWVFQISWKSWRMWKYSECSPETQLCTPNTAPRPHFTLWWACRYCFWTDMPDSPTRQWIRHSTMFDTCANKLLLHVWCVFLIYESLLTNQQTLKQSLKPSP